MCWSGRLSATRRSPSYSDCSINHSDQASTCTTRRHEWPYRSDAVGKNEPVLLRLLSRSSARIKSKGRPECVDGDTVCVHDSYYRQCLRQHHLHSAAATVNNEAVLSRHLASLSLFPVYTIGIEV